MSRKHKKSNQKAARNQCMLESSATQSSLRLFLELERGVEGAVEIV